MLKTVRLNSFQKRTPLQSALVVFDFVYPCFLFYFLCYSNLIGMFKVVMFYVSLSLGVQVSQSNSSNQVRYYCWYSSPPKI